MIDQNYLNMIYIETSYVNNICKFIFSHTNL